MGCPDLVMARKREPIFARDLMVRTKLGREIWVSVSTVLVPSRWKDLCVLVHLFRDVSYQKALEQSVKQLLATMASLAVPRETDSPTSVPASVPLAKLTRRELEVLRLLTSGASTKAIATELFISPSTVRNHVHNILAKLGVHSRLNAVTRSLRNGLI
jgi:DNA-binding NarL/FixJ family response regulator